VKANIADSNGGGLYFEGTGISSSANTMHVLGCEFFGNRTALGEGGAIYGSWVKGDVLNSTFTSNSADVGSGGAMSLTNMGASNLLTVANTVFWNNSANGTSISGGAVNLGESQPNVAHAANATFVNCTMADNVVGACVDGQAIYISTYSAPNSAIYNCILALNGGVGCPTSNPIGEGAAATVQYTDCYVPPPVIVLHGGTGNIQGDPLFRNHGVAGGLTLKALSPCIDSADYVQIPADIHDLDGDGDFAEKLPLDLLYQNRLINRIEPDTGHADPGYPGSTYLDMGAYEKP
jgi:hypothetical protein